MAEKAISEGIDRRWLVRNRSKVQHRMLRLYEFGKSWDIGETDSRQALWAIQSALIGVIFSLWRSAFLIQIDRNLASEVEHGERLLEILIDTNAFGFPQDVATAQLTAAYYINNATLRLYGLIHDSVTNSMLPPNVRTELQVFKPDLDARLMRMETEHEIWERALRAFDIVFREFKKLALARVF